MRRESLQYIRCEVSPGFSVKGCGVIPQGLKAGVRLSGSVALENCQRALLRGCFHLFYAKPTVTAGTDKNPNLL
jgi:hypothetical protein